MPDLVPIRRALLSVSDKTDLVPFAKALAALGAELVSTGGTARALADAGLPVTTIDALTGFPEIMDGRVKTLHPKVHGALLAVRDNPEHAEAMRAHGIRPIDLVCVNLYPFERTVAQPGVAQRDAIEHIDIGGPSMIRSASKNFDYVTVVTHPRQYDRVVNDLTLHNGATSRELRFELAAAAFARTAEYDAAISAWLGRRIPAGLPDVLRIGYTKVEDLRYGENPHQDATLYRDPASTGPSIVNAQQLHGKPLSYNNVLDAAAALELVKDLRRMGGARVGAAIVKHTNPCGAAVAAAAAEAVDAAFSGDPLAAYGGILAINRPVDAPAADAMTGKDKFLEVVAAPSFTDDALAILKSRWVNVRLLAVGEREGSTARKLDYRSIPGGMLVQDRDTRTASPEQWRHAAGPAPTSDQRAAAAVVWTTVKHLKSNAVAIGGSNCDGPEASGAGTYCLLGAGAGQMDRVTACRIAAEKAGPRAKGAVAASDAYFPFPDGPEILIDAGVSMIVHPGGSKRDEETLELCNRRGVTCMLTDVRHFRH